MRSATASLTTRHGLWALVLTLMVLAPPLNAGPAGAAEGTDKEPPSSPAPSAWQRLLERDPAAVDDPSIGPLERKMLEALSPEQAEAFALGSDPSAIELERGGTLAELLGAAMVAKPGLVYVPLAPCGLFSTAFQTAPVTGAMTANETREYSARSSVLPGGVGLTDQGGVAGCGVPDEAEVVVLHLRAVPSALRNATGFLKAWRGDLPEPASLVVDYEPLVDAPFQQRRWNATAIVELCPLGSCATAEFKIKTAALGAQVRGDLAGFFRQTELADLPTGPGSGLDADLLDGMEGADFSLVSHTHDGAEITTGVVGEPFVDPPLARDNEVMPIVLSLDGPSSLLDGDLLDGRDSDTLSTQVGNCLTVSASCPAMAPDALAARCWQTITAALAAINGTDLPLASATNRYVVQVGPGIYAEQVTMKSFVDIEGAGKGATKITTDAAVDNPALITADNAELRHLTVEITGGGTAIGIVDVSPSLKHVQAVSVAGAVTPQIGIGVSALAAAALPALSHVSASSAEDALVANALGAFAATVTVRGSRLAGGVNGVFLNSPPGGAIALANIVNTEIQGAAGLIGDPAYVCLGAHDLGFTELGADCQ